MSDHNEVTQPRPPDKSRLRQHMEQTDPSVTPPTARDLDPGLGTIVGDGIRTITELVEQLGVNINQLQDDFDQQIKTTNKDNETIDALHRELESYRQDLALKILQPLIFDLVALYDDLGRMLNGYGAEQGDEIAGVLGEVEGVRIDIQHMIERYGFELFLSPEQYFDKSMQRVQRVIPTNDAEQDYVIARRLRRGMRYGQRIIRPELVEIFRHRGTLGRNEADPSE